MARITTLFGLASSLPSNSTPTLVTGFFDLLHQEHQNFLSQAKLETNFLVVGVESDLRARQLKGLDRPYQPQFLRALNLSRLDSVDLVVLLPLNFNNPKFREELLAILKPRVLAVSSHSPNMDKKRALLEKYGGQLKIVYQHNPQISTTILAQKLYNLGS